MPKNAWLYMADFPRFIHHHLSVDNVKMSMSGKKYNSWGSMCGLLISVDVPSIAPTADGNLFQLPIFEIHSFS